MVDDRLGRMTKRTRFFLLSWAIGMFGAGLTLIGGNCWGLIPWLGGATGMTWVWSTHPKWGLFPE